MSEPTLVQESTGERAYVEPRTDLADNLEIKEPRKAWGLSDFFRNSPCSKTTFMNGIGAGVLVGVASFMFTKHVKRSCDFAVGAFGIVSAGSWGYCNYHREQVHNVNVMVMESLKKRKEENERKMKEAEANAASTGSAEAVVAE